jgi:hypothetical protein
MEDRMLKTGSFMLLFLLLVSMATAEIIPPERRADWVGVGVPGGIPGREVNCVTSECNTLWSGTVTTTSISAAVESAPDNTVVRIPAGSFSLADTVVVRRDNVTIRGQGMRITTLRIGEYPALQTQEYGATGRGSVTSGYTKGSNSIVVSDGSQILLNDLIFIYQDNDPALIWTRSGENDFALRFAARVTGINGNTISFTPKIPYGFSASLNPRFESHSNIQDFVGFEDLTIDGGTSEPWRSVYFVESYASWAKNIEIKNFGDTGIGALQSVNGEIRSCYVHDTNTVNDGYGVYLWSDYGGVGTNSGFLIEDNIFARLWLGVMFRGASYDVVSYNYVKDNSLPIGWHQTASFNSNHGAHGIMNLFEGNIGEQFQNDGYHGSTSHTTIFRNWFHGICSSDPIYCLYPAGNRKMIDLCRFSWYENIVGNVLGDASWTPVEYEMTGNDNDYEHSVIYRFGYPNMGNNYYNPANPPSNGDDGGNDPKVKQTVLRHGNYDYFNKAVVWDPGIADHSLPASFIYTSKPSWFGSVPWPPIGPDVAGYHYKIPAQLRFESMSDPKTCSQLGGNCCTQTCTGTTAGATDCASCCIGSCTASNCGNGACDAGEICSSCSSDCTQKGVADNNPCDDCIKQDELWSYIQLWKAGNASLAQLMESIRLWKQGC